MAFSLKSLKDALPCELDHIKTKLEKCPFCGGKITLQDRSLDKGELILYSESGMKRLLHLEHRCEEKHCRAGLFYGYSILKGGMKIYDKDCLENALLVVSRKTAFSIPWLYGATLKIYHFNATFDCLAQEYNDFHNFGMMIFELICYIYVLFLCSYVTVYVNFIFRIEFISQATNPKSELRLILRGLLMAGLPTLCWSLTKGFLLV